VEKLNGLDSTIEAVIVHVNKADTFWVGLTRLYLPPQLGLSLLDIVKHAVKTIIKTLGPNDRLAVVTYSSK
jgi:hypothetical protein